MDTHNEHYKPALSIADYLFNGAKTSREQSLGFELEHFVVEKDTLALVPYQVAADSDAPSVEKILHRIKRFYFETVYEDDTEGVAHLFGLAREKAAITLEPGAQLEISIGPAHSLAEIEQLYQQFRSEIDPVLDSMGLMLLELGYHPTSVAKEIPLLPKRRYQYMNEYFTQTGKHGICMMRATASTQVSVDFKSEADAIKKLRIANSLGPLFAFITDNSPVFEASKVGALGGTDAVSKSDYEVPKRMARMVCWDDTDPARSLIAEGSFDEGYNFMQYAQTLVNSPGIFLPNSGEGTDAALSTPSEPEYLGFTTFKQALPDEFIDEAMVLHILSLFFFDTRFKTYLELRQADSLPLPYALAFTALVCGIFYNPEALSTYSDYFAQVEAVDVASAKAALRSDGFDAELYGRKATDWFTEMLSFAKEGLNDEDKPYLQPLADLIQQRKTLLESTF